MKKILLVCTLALGFGAASFAQGPPQRTPADQIERLKTQITGITDAQSAKLLVIYQAQAKSMDSLMAAAGDDRMAAFQKMAPITAAYNAKLKAVLTPEQATAFQKQADERAERMRQRMGN
jgi:periplasmic protein CpxP/Spy